MKNLSEGGLLASLSEMKDDTRIYTRNILLTLLMAVPTMTQAQDIKIQVSPSPMVGMNIETKQPMAGVNLELISVGNDKRRVGAGINPSVYFDEKMSGKLGPSAQLTRKFDTGAELRAIVGAHGGNTFVGVGGKVTLGGKKKKKG